MPHTAWAGQRVFILGGGPSLPLGIVSKLEGKGKVIAINTAFKVAPWADILYFADRRWFRWNRDDIPSFRGVVLTRCHLTSRDGAYSHIRRVPYFRDHVLTYRGGISGWCSGANALNLAYVLGAKEVYLFGFDMGGGNWHNEHKIVSNAGYMRKHALPSIEKMAAELALTSMRIINVSANTAIKGFPVLNPEDFHV